MSQRGLFIALAAAALTFSACRDSKAPGRAAEEYQVVTEGEGGEGSSTALGVGADAFGSTPAMTDTSVDTTTAFTIMPDGTTVATSSSGETLAGQLPPIDQGTAVTRPPVGYVPPPATPSAQPPVPPAQRRPVEPDPTPQEPEPERPRNVEPPPTRQPEPPPYQPVPTHSNIPTQDEPRDPPPPTTSNPPTQSNPDPYPVGGPEEEPPPGH